MAATLKFIDYNVAMTFILIIIIIIIHVIASFTRSVTKRPDWLVSPTPLVFNAPGGGVPLGRSS